MNGIFMIRVGILSDTHISSPSGEFIENCRRAFEGCEAIIHAGDLTDMSVLSAFEGKEVHGVHGNMCGGAVRMNLPAEKRIGIGGYTIGITHGAGSRHDIEGRVYSLFPDADCIVFGHSHIPLVRKYGSTLLVNPGSFLGTGPHGASGTYALLDIGPSGLKAKIHTL
jgi:putative phosphoesterase